MHHLGLRKVLGSLGNKAAPPTQQSSSSATAHSNLSPHPQYGYGLHCSTWFKIPLKTTWFAGQKASRLQNWRPRTSKITQTHERVNLKSKHTIRIWLGNQRNTWEKCLCIKHLSSRHTPNHNIYQQLYLYTWHTIMAFSNGHFPKNHFFTLTVHWSCARGPDPVPWKIKRSLVPARQFKVPSFLHTTSQILSSVNWRKDNLV